jgi:hypothetical protein
MSTESMSSLEMEISFEEIVGENIEKIKKEDNFIC